MGEQQTENNLGYAMYLQMSLRKLAHKSGSKMSNREA